MKPKNRNLWSVIIITFVAAVIVFQVSRFDPIENPSFSQFPLQIGDWKGKDIPMEAYVYEGLQTPYFFLRNYYSPKYPYPVNLSIVWFDDRNIAFHAPEACFGGIGNTVQDKSVIRITLDRDYEFGRLLVKQNDAEHLVLYFFDADGAITLSQTALRLKILSRKLLFKRGSASFVRLMVPVKGDQDAALSQMREFLDELFPLLPEYTHTDNITLKHPE